MLVWLNVWGGSKACLLFYFSVSVSKYSNSVFKFYILVEWGHVPINVFNVKNDCWDVCKPPTVLLPGERRPQERRRHSLTGCCLPLRRTRTPPLPPPPSSQGLWPTRLQAWGWQSAAQGLGKGASVPPAAWPTASALVPPGRDYEASGSPCVKDVGIHCLKSIASFPLKNLGVNLPCPPFFFFGSVVFGCRVMKNTKPASQIIGCVVHESASFQSAQIVKSSWRVVSWLFILLFFSVQSWAAVTLC